MSTQMPPKKGDLILSGNMDFSVFPAADSASVNKFVMDKPNKMMPTIARSAGPLANKTFARDLPLAHVALHARAIDSEKMFEPIQIETQNQAREAEAPAPSAFRKDLSFSTGSAMTGTGGFGMQTRSARNNNTGISNVSSSSSAHAAQEAGSTTARRSDALDKSPPAPDAKSEQQLPLHVDAGSSSSSQNRDQLHEQPPAPRVSRAVQDLEYIPLSAADDTGASSSSSAAGTSTAIARSAEFKQEIERMRHEAEIIQHEIQTEYTNDMAQAHAEFESDIQDAAEYERNQLMKEVGDIEEIAGKIDGIAARVNEVRRLYSRSATMATRAQI
jgi:hypothetical protein